MKDAVRGLGGRRRGGEVVLVNLREVVCSHGEPPFGSDRGSAAAVKLGDAAIVLGVAEDRLDDVLALPVQPLAVLGREKCSYCGRRPALSSGASGTRGGSTRGTPLGWARRRSPYCHGC